MALNQQNYFLWLTVTIAATAGLLFGFDIGNIAGALIFIQHSFHTSTATPAEVTCLLLTIYLPQRAQRTQRMGKFRNFSQMYLLKKPQIPLCELSGKISSGNSCSCCKCHYIGLDVDPKLFCVASLVVCHDI